ncbi:MAG: PAS domain S-box protein [Proteobacteria bacterium]|nr:PAS domain S-box protein [Pseudomonadota bacterium]MBU4295865.1 PAS domain S-box protein [Pseudomonadota bacterium]MCG2747027.1 ATP-binding protein [Desulfobulbaceae bacterium]
MNSSMRILHLEDDFNDAELVRTALEEGGYRLDVACVETKADFIAALADNEYDIILADYMLPSFDGLSALAIAQEKTPEVPFIFVSGVMGEELAIDTLKNGATDYVLKQRMSRLAPAVCRALKEANELIKRNRAEQELKKYHEQLEELVRERTAELSSTIDQLKHEICERRRAEKEREKTEEQFRLLVEGVMDYAIFMIDPAGRVLSWNEGAERIKGYRADEIFGRHFSSFYTEEDVKQGKPANHLKIADEQGSYEEDSLMVRKDGSQFWANVVITALRDEAGRLRGFSKVIRDISERRRAEEKLRTTADELARSNAELTRFAAIVAHDLQEPLRVIDGFINLLARRYQGRLDEKADEFIGFTVEGVKRMQQLIKDLLEYSKVGTRGTILETVDFSAAVDKAVLNLQAAVRDINAVITRDSLPTLMANASLISRLFQNLIGNALKFHGKEPMQVHISAEQKENRWILSVRDNGIGIEPKYAETIFGMFQRLHTTREYPGTGIGLAVCKRIVEHHGGEIWLESEPGKGSTFYFTSPARLPEGNI